jgi:hypothetical protein
MTASQTNAARDRVSVALEAAKVKTAEAARATSDGIGANPLTAVAGGIAVGAVIGALLPRTAQENKLLGAVSDQIKASAKDALVAAKAAGVAKLTEAGISGVAAQDKVQALIEGAASAVSSAGSAAHDSVKSSRSPA